MQQVNSNMQSKIKCRNVQKVQIACKLHAISFSSLGSTHFCWRKLRKLSSPTRILRYATFSFHHATRLFWTIILIFSSRKTQRHEQRNALPTFFRKRNLISEKNIERNDTKSKHGANSHGGTVVAHTRGTHSCNCTHFYFSMQQIEQNWSQKWCMQFQVVWGF